MPTFSIRPAELADLDQCLAMDSSYSTDFVWQMDTHSNDGQISAAFRTVRLPRSMRVAYPRSARQLAQHWRQCEGFLVAASGNRIIGYAALVTQPDQGVACITDLVVEPTRRRQGLGAALVAAAVDWARQRGLGRLMVELQTKNYPAICFCQKLGLVFCGFNDRYYANQDIALFFALGLR